MNRRTVPHTGVIGRKKGIHFYVLTVALLCFTVGCSRRSSTADALVSEFLRAAKAGDYAAVLECMPKEVRNEQAELRRKDLTWYRDAMKEKTNELSRQYGGAKIAGSATPHESESGSSKTQEYSVRVANVLVETRPGNFLRMDQHVILKEENRRWAIIGFEPAPLTE